MSSTANSEQDAKVARKKERMAKCQACPDAIGGNSRKYICGRCGCVLAAKVSLPGARCPAGKW